MCVIINIEDGNFPKLQTLKDAESLNSHGGSIAWLESGKINYHKGLKAKKINKIIQKLLKPKGVTTAIIHFRIASVGDVNSKLCHPFPISNDVSLDLKVIDSKHDLLFHNGTVDEWETLLIKSIQGKNVTIPSGDISDSRIVAFLVDMYGLDLLDKIGGWNKFSILTKDGIKKYGHWVNVDGNDCSNNYFVKSQFYNRFEQYSDDYADVEYLDDIDCDIKSRQKFNSKSAIKSDSDSFNEDNFDLYGICHDKNDLKTYKAIQKLGMDDDTIMYYVDMGYELQEILKLATNPDWWEDRENTEDYIRSFN